MRTWTVVLLSLVLIAGCGDDKSTSPSTEDQLVGIWEGTGLAWGATWVFRADGTFRLVIDADNIFFGTYTLEGALLSATGQSCSGPGGGECHSAINSYDISILETEDGLQLTTVSFGGSLTWNKV